VVEGIAHTQSLAAEHGDHASLAARIEVDKARFAGGEIAGKTLAVAGLGRVGGLVAEAAVLLGMDVVGYDPTISVDEAWRLPHSLRRVDSLQKAAAVADFLTVHDQADGADAPGRVSASTLASLKPHCNVLNFARGGASGASAVDGAALRVRYDAGALSGKYICDHADASMQDHPSFVCMPALGDATTEATDNSEAMAAAQLARFLEEGAVTNSVNFPNTALAPLSSQHTRLCLINQNRPGMIGAITSLLGERGVNIAQQINTSRGEIAYNVVDIPDAEGAEVTLAALHYLEGVLSTRLIYTGSADAGPSHFQVSNENKDNIAAKLLQARFMSDM